MAKEKVARRLAAILAADVVGYSRLVGLDEEGTIARLKTLRQELIEPGIAQHKGRIVKTTGDGILVEFASVVDAVRAAVAVQRALAEREAEVPDDRRIAIRVGVNLGDIVIDGDDILGDGVNVAARLEALAEPGGISLSDDAYRQVRDKLDIAFADAGEQELKNISRPVRVWRWTGVGAAAPTMAKAPALELPDKPSIAVLPFENMSGDPEQEYFTDGITEDIITALSHIRWLFVIARNSSFTFRGRAVDVSAVAEALGVRYVLEGSVRKFGNRVRITAQLIDGHSGNHVWADRFDRELEDIFAIQDEITHTVVGAIEPELSRAEQERAQRKSPKDMDAWDCYQRGLWHMWRYNIEDMIEAQSLFERAVEFDANISVFHASLAYTHLAVLLYDWADVREKSWNAASKAAQTAIAIDERDAIAHWALGVYYLFRSDHSSAIDELKKSLEINPSFAPAHTHTGIARVYGNQAEAGLSSLDEAERLNPRDPMNWLVMMGRTFAYFFIGDFEEAVSWGRKTIHNPKAIFWANAVYAAALARLDRNEEARAAVDELLKRKPGFSLTFAKQTYPLSEPAMEKFLIGLAKAGLPE